MTYLLCFREIDRERERISRISNLIFRISNPCSAGAKVGLDLTTISTPPEANPRPGYLAHGATQAPLWSLFLHLFCLFFTNKFLCYIWSVYSVKKNKDERIQLITNIGNSDSGSILHMHVPLKLCVCVWGVCANTCVLTVSMGQDSGVA